MSERVTVSMKDGVADVRLNRPEKLNALDRPMFEALVDAGQRAVGRSQRCAPWCCRARGAPSAPGSTSPASWRWRGEGSDPGAPLLDRRSADSPANFAQHAAYVWTEVPVPVIAALHGVAFGGGLQIALGADIRFVAPDAQLSVMEIKWGLMPDMSGTQTLRHLVRLDVAKELTFTGRIVEGREAVALGPGRRASPSIRAPPPWRWRARSPRSRPTRSAPASACSTPPRGQRGDGLRLEEQLQRGLLGSPNQVEAVQRQHAEARAAVRRPRVTHAPLT